MLNFNDRMYFVNVGASFFFKDVPISQVVYKMFKFNDSMYT